MLISESVTFMRLIDSIETHRDLRRSVMTVRAGALRADAADLIRHRD
jgi:hypothetical protein